MNFVLNEHGHIEDVTKQNTITFHGYVPDCAKDKYRLMDADAFFKDCKTDEEKIIKIIKMTDLDCKYNFNADEQFQIEIIWGDWKHQHRFCHTLMNAIGYSGTEQITEEDGTDCYSAIHTYVKNS